MMQTGEPPRIDWNRWPDAGYQATAGQKESEDETTVFCSRLIQAMPHLLRTLSVFEYGSIDRHSSGPASPRISGNDRHANARVRKHGRRSKQ